MATRVIARNEVIAAFEPLHGVLQAIIVDARQKTTLERFANLHPEIEREAALKRLAGQARWMLIAEGLAAQISSIKGFSVRTSDAQHNSGQYVFAFPGGIFTVRREPHDDTDPDDGKYIQQVLTEILEQAEVAPGVDAEAPIVVYVSVTPAAAVLKVCHPTLSEVMKIAVDDLMPEPQRLPADPDRRRARARSARTDARPDSGSVEAPASPS